MAQQAVSTFQFVKEFSCLAERCEDNCCKVWPVSVGARTIELWDQKLPQLLNLIVKDDGGTWMKKTDGDCVAFDNGRCSVHATHGEDALSDTCRIYPRMYRRINGALTGSASMSCPEIVRLVLKSATPFAPAQVTVDDKTLSAYPDKDFPGIDAEQRAAVVHQISELVLQDQQTTRHALLRLLDLTLKLETIACEDWLYALPGLIMDYQTPAGSGESLAVDPVMVVLIQMLNGPGVTEAMREQVIRSVDVTPAQGDQPQGMRLKTEFLDLASGRAGQALEPVLKRFVCAEMSRTGFPFISTTAYGQDYGASLSQWACTLALRTLALRCLLLVHCDPVTRQAPDEQAIVDLVYRFCRSANHSVATGAELFFRQKLGQHGLGYLRVLTDQL